MLFQTCMSFFLLLHTKRYILKNVGNQTVAGSHWLLQYGEKYYESQWEPETYCLATHILQNIFYCVQQKKQTHIGLEQHWVNDWFD